jgi:ribosomal protein S27E
MSGFYYRHGNQKFGPVSAERLKQLAATGGLAPDDLVAQEGSAKWYEASSVKGLFPAGPAATPQHGQQVLPVAQVSKGTATPTPLRAEVVVDSDAGAGATYVPCPHCHNYLVVTPGMAGRAMQCPHCGATVQMPGAAVPSATPAPKEKSPSEALKEAATVVGAALLQRVKRGLTPKADSPEISTEGRSMAATPLPADNAVSADVWADSTAASPPDSEPLDFLSQPPSPRAGRGVPKKPATLWGEAVGELKTSLKGHTRKATKFTIKLAIGFVALIVLCSGLAFLGNLAGPAGYSHGKIVTSASEAKDIIPGVWLCTLKSELGYFQVKLKIVRDGTFQISEQHDAVDKEWREEGHGTWAIETHNDSKTGKPLYCIAFKYSGERNMIVWDFLIIEDSNFIQHSNPNPAEPFIVFRR